MNLMSILTIGWYTLQPLLWVIVVAVALLVLVQLLARVRGYYFLAPAKIVSVVMSFMVGLWAMVIVPILTDSSFTMVATGFDWFALTLVGLGVGAYCWLIVHPMIYLFRPSLP
ncbi:MAG: hypothetical protein LAT62_00025 [Natronospirillum sp.]|uniref:hypothetical protein n=1 Tax=Natronospirillum sp. TaxID=2812955 RepID=UPI0025D09F1E|nr:hypothetical protein [Natronospirillum sp.]MCH8550286.1 hypothetical protein [Natronospirillum sp.]